MKTAPQHAKYVAAVLLSALLSSVALAANPPEAIGSLFTADEHKYLCTATAVAGKDLGAAQDLVILTAAHCVNKDLSQDDKTQAWYSEKDFVVSFDGDTFYPVHPQRVGITEQGYDVATMLFIDKTPELTPLQMGSWEQVDFGSNIQNYANPLGMGIQYFTGAITMKHITPSAINKKPQWHHNAVASLQVGPGSSGSLILNEDYEYVGVLSGVMEARFGSPFTIIVPQWRFEDFLSSDEVAHTLTCAACDAAQDAFYASMSGVAIQ